MSKPLVTILLPVYNGEKYIKTSLDSIVQQSYEHIEILIINDGSADKTVEIIEGFSDPRINLVHNEVNLGLIKTLNKGLKIAKGKYIARMDADDYSYPDRIELQVEYLENNSNIGIVGTWFENYKNDQFDSLVQYASDNNTIKLKQLHQIHLCHGTAMFRKSVLEKNNLEFNINYKHAEDFELWSRLKNFCEMANIPKVLYRVNQHGENVSLQNNGTQVENTLKIIGNQLKYITEKPISENLIPNFVRLCEADFSLKTNELSELGYVISNMVSAKESNKSLDKDSFDEYWKTIWNNQCLNTQEKGMKLYQTWNQYPNLKKKNIGFKLFIKCILKK